MERFVYERFVFETTLNKLGGGGLVPIIIKILNQGGYTNIHNIADTVLQLNTAYFSKPKHEMLY